jgi:hypothetical protein
MHHGASAMIHPVFRLVAAQPQWLAVHAAAYAGLVSEELALSGAGLRRRLVLQLAGAACLLLAATLAGVALLLWAALPEAGLRQPWLLVLIPALPLMAGLWVLQLSRSQSTHDPLARLRLQLSEDAALLRSSGAP